jgi:hypothetical protein
MPRLWIIYLLSLLLPLSLCAQQSAFLPDSSRISLRPFDTTDLATYRADRAFDYGKRPETDSPFKRWWEDFKRRLQRMLSSRDSVVGSLLRYGLILGAVLLLIYHFKNVRSGGFLNRRTRRRDGGMEVFKERVEVKSLDSRIEESVGDGDFRSAYRWLYIKLLATLRDKDMVRTDRHKTNRDYIREMDRAGHGEAFTPLAEAFDYIWYGDYAIDKEQYERYTEEVRTFEGQITS